MKAVMIRKPYDLQIVDMDKPVITEHDNVLIKEQSFVKRILYSYLDVVL